MYEKNDTMQANKYVLDCNVYISYIINGKLADLTEYIVLNDIEIIFCRELEAEIIDVLQRNHIKKYLKYTSNDYLEAIHLFTKNVKKTRQYKGSPDIKDDYLFSLCLSTKSTLVTGDKKLLNFKETPIPVISTTAFKKLF